MKYNNLFIALILHISFASHNNFCSESSQQAMPWWHKIKVYMASWIPAVYLREISYLNIPTQQVALSNPTRDYLELTVTERLISILKNGKNKNYPIIKQMNTLIDSTFEVAQEYSLDAESIINNSINTILDKINPKSMQQDFNLFTNMKEFMQNKLREKKETQ